MSPGLEANSKPENPPSSADHRGSAAEPRRDETVEETNALVGQIEAMAESLGRRLYRGILKTVARVWKPSKIRDADVLKRALAQMQSAERGLRRLEVALDRVGADAVVPTLRSMRLDSMEQVDCMESLKKVVLAAEEAAGLTH